MLIDWITAKLDEKFLNEEQTRILRSRADRIIRISASTGEQVYETQAWDSIRSDSHSITIRMSSDCLFVCGSPARVIGDGDAVFSSGVCSKLDLRGCLDAVIKFVSIQTGVFLPCSDNWKVTRIDVTDNLLLDSQQQVIEALDILNRTDGGRYKVSNKAGNSIYWGSKSRRYKGKAYAKGEHLTYMMALKGYDGKRYSFDEIEAANKLLRLELTIGAQTMRELSHWSDLTPMDLALEHSRYFDRMIGDTNMTSVSKLQEKLQEICPTSGQAKSAFMLFTYIRAHGFKKAKSDTSSSTFYRNQRYLKLAGLADSDISTGEIVALRRRVLECSSVNSWSDLMAAA
jgi:II/X family phage/plasmid replication protein